MNEPARIFVYALLLSLAAVASAPRPTNTIDAYAAFSEMRANAPVGGCGCFWMAGGHGGLSIPVWHDVSAVVETGGHTTSNLPPFNTGASPFYEMGGVRGA